jgi:hypothetical protein
MKFIPQSNGISIGFRLVIRLYHRSGNRKGLPMYLMYCMFQLGFWRKECILIGFQ